MLPLSGAMNAEVLLEYTCCVQKLDDNRNFGRYNDRSRNVLVYTYIHTYIHIYIYIYTYTHTHTHIVCNVHVAQKQTSFSSNVMWKNIKDEEWKDIEYCRLILTATLCFHLSTYAEQNFAYL